MTRKKPAGSTVLIQPDTCSKVLWQILMDLFIPDGILHTWVIRVLLTRFHHTVLIVYHGETSSGPTSS
jgi:hypothetical protein